MFLRWCKKLFFAPLTNPSECEIEGASFCGKLDSSDHWVANLPFLPWCGCWWVIQWVMFHGFVICICDCFAFKFSPSKFKSSEIVKSRSRFHCDLFWLETGLGPGGDSTLDLRSSAVMSHILFSRSSFFLTNTSSHLVALLKAFFGPLHLTDTLHFPAFFVPAFLHQIHGGFIALRLSGILLKDPSHFPSCFLQSCLIFHPCFPLPHSCLLIMNSFSHHIYGDPSKDAWVRGVPLPTCGASSPSSSAFCFRGTRKSPHMRDATSEFLRSMRAATISKCPILVVPLSTLGLYCLNHLMYHFSYSFLILKTSTQSSALNSTHDETARQSSV